MIISPYVFPGLKHEMIPSLHIKSNLKKIQTKTVIEIVSKNCGVTVEELLSKDRHRNIVNARIILCGILRNEYNYTYTYISKVVKRLEHTSSIHSVKCYNKNYYNKESFKSLVNDIIFKINISS